MRNTGMAPNVQTNESVPEDNGQPVGSGGWLNRNVVGMGLTSFLSDAGHEMATSVLPGFLAAITAPTYVLGLIEGLADALSSFVKLGAGWWSDRIGQRKAIATAGYALTGGGIALFAFAASWPLVLFGRMLAWFGRGIRGPLRDAMLAESVAYQDRGKAFGFHRAGDTLGAVVGPLLGAACLPFLQTFLTTDASAPFRTIFLLTLFPGLGAAVAFAVLVREQRRSPQTIPFWASVRSLPRNFRRYLVGVGIFGAGDFSHTLLILAAIQLLTPIHGLVEATQIGALLYALRNVLYAGASYPVGSVSDRYGRRGLLVLGYLLGGITTVGFATVFATSTTSILVLGLLFGLSGLFIAVVDTLEGALTADLVPDEMTRGTAYGVLGMVNGVGDFLSSGLVGLLWGFSPALGFGYAAAMMFLGAVLLQRVR
jgi:MFS family permease